MAPDPPILLALLLGCSSPAPSLVLPIGPPAEHAVTRPLHAFLTPTAFGAEGELLCPWARGEAVADASIGRWMAEGRIAWRALDVGEKTTFGGGPLSAALALSDAIDTLEDRCDAQLDRDYLVVAGPSAQTGGVFTGIYELGKAGFEQPWLVVDDPQPAGDAGVERAPAHTPEVVKEDAPAQKGDRGIAPSRLLEALGRGADWLPSGEPAPVVFTLVVGPPSRGMASDGRPEMTVEETLALRPECLIVAASDEATWGATVALVDRGRGAGSGVMLAKTYEKDGSTGSNAVATHVTATTGQTASASAALHAPIPVLALQIPTYRGGNFSCAIAGTADE